MAMFRGAAADLATRYRRYRYARLHRQNYTAPTVDGLRLELDPLLKAEQDHVRHVAYLDLRGSKPPWTTTGIELDAGEFVSVLAAGRLWRSKPLDLWIRPQLGLWSRIGENGTVFNSTRDTNTFRANVSGHLYLGTQFPGQFGDPTGRVQSPLGIYDDVDGGFVVAIIVWRGDPSVSFNAMLRKGDPFSLISTELSRQAYSETKPENWNFLWFLGVSDIFSSSDFKGEECVHCRTEGNVGILQKDIATPLAPDTELRWDWIISALPSRLREDTALSHDYLSIAVEFENGRDITYHWSHELPVDYGYWCPLPTWRDREFHVVIRSGTDNLGKWLSESRNLFDDYTNYIGPPPQRILRVWLIASSRWQRFGGDMVIKNVRVGSEISSVRVI